MRIDDPILPLNPESQYDKQLNRFLYDYLRKLGRVLAGDSAYYVVPCSDLTTNLSAGTNVGYRRIIKKCKVKEIRASLLTASSSGAVTIDVNVNGSTILSTKLTIDQGEKTSLTAATRYVITLTDLNEDDEVTFDIDGAGTGAKGLIVSLITDQ